ncbi:MAG: hypothetical protein LBR46_01495 [Prevotella sp.]|jgi:hypothetical protein|nr:hypothetical protein [Prevotella sp.]
MKIQLIIVLGIILHMLSCSDKNNYKENNSVIPDSLYTFFPETKHIKDANEYFRSSNAMVTSNDTVWFFSVTYNFRAYKFVNPKVLDSLVAKYRENCIAEFKVNTDSTYFIISEKEEMKKLYELNNLERIYKMFKDKYMLPSFHSLMLDKYGYNYRFRTICGLSEDYEILIIKSGREFVLPKNLDYNWYILPPELKHGYTSGIAYSRKELDIIYWVIAW